MSREDHRKHDETQRAIEGNHKTESAERRRKEKRDLAMAIILAVVFFVLTLFLRVIWAGIAGFIGLLAFAGYIGNLERMVRVKATKIRKIQAAIVILGFGLECFALNPFWKKEQATALEGEIHARNPQVLKHPIIQWGNAGPLIEWKPENAALKLFREAGISFEMGPDGIEVSTTVRDRSGHRVAEINKNHWTVEPPPSSVDKNYTDDTLEVLDGGGHVVLQVRLLSDRVQLRGEWHDEYGSGEQITECADPYNKKETTSCIELFGPNLPEQTNKISIGPIFEYPSKDHWGEFRKKK
jgi:hypothetical protein